ncbi:slc36a4, partial [Symbiodinium pilosum]
ISVLALAVYAYLLVILPIRWGTVELSSGRAPSLSGVWSKFEPGNLGQWLGTSIFAQEAVVVSQCVYQDMHLRDYRAFRPVLVSSFMICSIASTALAAFGCMCYGDSVKQVFYLNFPTTSLDVSLAEAILCLVLLPTFVIQLYPVARCVDELLTCTGYVSLSSDDSDETLEESEENRGQGSVVKILARWLLVVISCVLAAVMPDLACVSGYSGSFAMSVIGFFLPPLIHLKLHHFRVSALDWFLDLGLLAVGVTALVLGVSNTHCSAS